MSRLLIARSPDLQKLRSDGFDIEVRQGYLLIKDVPYVNSNKVVARGMLISKLELANDTTVQPQDHVAYWSGEHPCHSDGRQISSIQNPSPPQNFGEGIQADHTFSAKASYRNYHHKMTAYIARITGEARVLDSSVRAETFPLSLPDDPESVFKYEDTASSRVNIGSFNQKLAHQRIGIIGLGGTGSYVLDFVAKTLVKEIHLFDGDLFLQHNAFRAPGAANGQAIERKQKKVLYWADTYAAMRNGIVAHEHYLDESTLDSLQGLDFVFLCMDSGEAKTHVICRLESMGLSFIDVGLGIAPYGDSLGGLLRVSTSTPENRQTARDFISTKEVIDDVNEYSTNIQVVELNALNAAFAVIRWKKLLGFYYDGAKEHNSGYSIGHNETTNNGGKD